MHLPWLVFLLSLIWTGGYSFAQMNEQPFPQPAPQPVLFPGETIPSAFAERTRTTFAEAAIPSLEPTCVIPNCCDVAVAGPPVWGRAGIRAFLTGEQIAPNGVEFNPLFVLDLNFNFWLWREEKLYLYTDNRFWGQKPAPGITNAHQGIFDFSKREFDLDIGVAWNYYANLEARIFAYSLGNLNRGTSLVQPNGFNDGVGLENRWYVGSMYSQLGAPSFDVSRATFFSLGYYPSNGMVDLDGFGFKPGPFARAFLTYDFNDKYCYYFLDAKALATHSFTPKELSIDQGIAFRPFEKSSSVELRLGADGIYDLQRHEINMKYYLSLSFVY